MKKKFKQTGVLLFMLLTVFITNGCSNDDNKNNSSDDIIIEGGDVFRYKITEVNVPNVELNQNDYEGNLGGINVKIFKIDEYKLAFSVPVDAPLGNIELIIPELNNAKINYNVLNPELEKSVAETLTLYFTLINNTFTSIEDLDLSTSSGFNNYNQIKNYLETQADDETKLGAALYFQVNKDYIEDLFSGNYFGEAKLNSNEKKLLKEFGKSAYILGAGVWTTYAGYTLLKGSPTVSLWALGAGLSGTIMTVVGFERCKKYGFQIAEADFLGYGTVINGIIGANNKGVTGYKNNEITFNDNRERVLSFILKTRQLSENDSNSTKNILVDFFSHKNKLNDFITKINEAVQWFSEKLSITTEPIKLYTLSANPATAEKSVTTDIMQGISFSINHPNLELVTASLSGEGQLNLKVKIIGNPQITPVESTLNYSYSDEVSSFSGSFPIKVNSEVYSLVGNWILIEGWEGSTGNWHHMSDGNCYYETGSMIFTATTFSSSINTKKSYNCDGVSNDISVTNFSGTYNNKPTMTNGTLQFTIMQESGVDDFESWTNDSSVIIVVDEDTIIHRPFDSSDGNLGDAPNFKYVRQ